MHGRGTRYYANGNKYTGDWVEDKPHGTGVLFNAAEGTKRQGEWVNGKRKGWLGRA
jgi:hypothetical protein